MNENQNKSSIAHRLIPFLLVIIGISMMVYMIIVEDEPGAIPLLMIVAGTVWYLLCRRRLRNRSMFDI
ncbi:PEP-CTERM sorting domain-containing protein [Rhodohalobacter sp. SW132]|uniref:PEP-CTERM sorting domain-containing protein n=1 Tax=Rhodohalobacter sp. SW132 TaxID=2293433 RepID=UPI000E2649C7|nr:PEP-CTERM sorting domain-containing protein [Rhodohalobacter sp. SW132]REL37905.1 PEP-CTERM sorting domain-containing protein [Rhodohalobacter sp. SW132]